VEGVSRDADGAIQIHVIEGNNPDRVQRAVYALTDRRIYGFGTPVQRAYTNLKIYNHNEDVARLQQSLAELGYYTREEGQDGRFTKEVLNAVRALQKAGGLAASGIVDIKTRALMDAQIRVRIYSSR
jgi:peptidoglycan hydrolase-like protein with peptidoglycan-binding domain